MSTIAHTAHGPVEYRSAGAGPTVLVLNGGHTDCHSPLGHERFLLDAGYRLLVPSRPGYGRTPSATGRTAEASADALAALLDALGVGRAVVIGISAAGRTALQLAGRYPGRVAKLILQNAITAGRYPTGLTRLGTYAVFNPAVERWTWACFRAFARRAPDAALRIMLGQLSTLPPARVAALMRPEQRRAALAFLLASRSGGGFLNDIRHDCGDLGRITAPTLIIDSRYDGAKDPSHATYAAAHIAGSALFISPAESHLLWFSDHDAAIRERMRVFLDGCAGG